MTADFLLSDEVLIHRLENVSANDKELVGICRQAALRLRSMVALKAVAQPVTLAGFVGSPEEGTMSGGGEDAEGRTIAVGDLAFTERQFSVLLLLLEGKTNKEIARSLGVGEATVKYHMRSLFALAGAHTRTAVTVWAFNHGIRAGQAAL